MADFMTELKLTVKETTGATVTLPSVQTAFVRKSLFFDRYAERLAALIEAVDDLHVEFGHGNDVMDEHRSGHRGAKGIERT